MRKKLSILLVILLMTLTACGQEANQAVEVTTEEDTSDEVSKVDLNLDQLNQYYGRWTISDLYFSNLPSTWAKSDLEPYVGMELAISKDQVSFDGLVLESPSYREEVMTSEVLYERLLMTYETLEMDYEEPPLFVTICTEPSLNDDSVWSSESLIYRFFVKDETTLVAENKNVYLILTRVD